MRFLIDENLPAELVDVLEAHGHDALFVPHSSLQGASDSELNEFAILDERLIVTRDLDFPLRKGRTPPGLVIIRAPSAFGIPEFVRLMRNFVTSDSLNAAPGSITVVAPGRIRSRRLNDA